MYEPDDLHESNEVLGELLYEEEQKEVLADEELRAESRSISKATRPDRDEERPPWRRAISGP